MNNIAPDFLKGGSWEFPNVEKYLNKTLPFPEAVEDDPEFYKAVCFATFARFVSNQTTLPYSYSDGILNAWAARSYGRYGHAGIGKYVEWLCPTASYTGGQEGGEGGQIQFGGGQMGEAENPATMKSYMNISWKPDPVLPYMRGVAKGLILGQKYRVNAFANDPTSHETRELEKEAAKLQFDPTWQNFIAQMKGAGANIPQDPQKFNSPEDIDTFFRMGGFKFKREMDIIDLLNGTRMESGYDESIAEKLVEDLLDLSRCAIESYVDSATQVVKWRYVDAATVGGRHSQYNDCRDQDFVFSLERMSLMDIRRETNATYDDIKQLITCYQKFNNNLYINAEVYNSWDASNGIAMRPYSNFYIWVMKLYYRSAPPNGKTEGKELSTADDEVLYQCKWAVGTDFVWNYGRAFDVGYMEKNGNWEACLPIRIYQTNQQSFVQSCSAFQDDINLDTYKKRNCLAKLPPPPRLLVDTTTTENISIGGIVYTWEQCQDIFAQMGYYYVQTLNDFRQQNSALVGDPVKPIQMGVVEDIMLYNQNIQFNTERMKLVLGLNDTVMAQSQPERKAVRVVNSEIAATNNAMWSLFNAYKTIFLSALRVSALQWQVVCANNKNKKVRWFGVSPDTYVEVGLNKEISDSDMGIYLTLEATNEELDAMMDDVIQLKNQRLQTGTGGIDMATYFLVANEIKAGNALKAQWLIASSVKATMMQDAAQQAQNVQQTAQAQQQSNQQAAQNEQQLEQIKQQFQKELMQFEAAIKEQLAQSDHQRNMELAGAQGQVEMAKTQTQQAGESGRQIIKSTTELQATHMKEEGKKEAAKNKPTEKPKPKANAK